MIHVFHGEDEYSLRQTLDGMKAKLGDEATADLNTTVLDGRSLALDELRMACDTMPFLAEQRLIIVEGLLVRYEPRPGAADAARPRADPLENGLRAYLPALAESAVLVFVERFPLSDRNPMLKLIKDAGGRVRLFASPIGAELTSWIMKQVRAEDATISPRAAETLATFVGGNLRQLAQEIDKLIAYAGGKEIREQDVEVLVGDARELKVWTLTDAVAAQDHDRAVGALHRMLGDGSPPPLLLAMLTRRFRELVLVKELAEANLSVEEIAGRMRMGPYPAKKASDTARAFTFDRLDAIYQRLLQSDLAVKSGRLDPALALDLLVYELTAGARR